MRKFWRISSYADLSGIGAKKASARWHTKGNLVVYLAENPAGAMLERLVHLLDTEGQLPRMYDLLSLEAPENIAVKDIEAKGVTWKEDFDWTRQLGDIWLASLETPLARVPSAIVPHTWNYLLNPEHPDAVQVQILSATRERFDNRLFRFGAR